MRYELTTAKGKTESDSLEAIASWQREQQGSFASLRDNERDVEISVDDVDFSDDAAVQAITQMLQDES